MGENTGGLSCYENFREDVQQLEAQFVRLNQFVELFNHLGVVGLGVGVNGNHTRCVAHAENFFAGELPMDVACEGGLELDVFDVALTVQYALIEVRNRPTERNVIDKEFGEFLCGLGGVGVAPGAEGNKDLVFAVERHITVHHCGDADGCEVFDFYAVLFLDVGAEVLVTILQTLPNQVYAVCPEAVNLLVFPAERALGDRIVFVVDEDGLYAGGAKLDTEDGLAGFYYLFCTHFFFTELNELIQIFIELITKIQQVVFLLANLTNRVSYDYQPCILTRRLVSNLCLPKFTIIPNLKLVIFI